MINSRSVKPRSGGRAAPVRGHLRLPEERAHFDRVLLPVILCEMDIRVRGIALRPQPRADFSFRHKPVERCPNRLESDPRREVNARARALYVSAPVIVPFFSSVRVL